MLAGVRHDRLTQSCFSFAAASLCSPSESLAKVLAVRSLELANEQHGQLTDALDRLVSFVLCNTFASTSPASYPPPPLGCETAVSSETIPLQLVSKPRMSWNDGTCFCYRPTTTLGVQKTCPPPFRIIVLPVSSFANLIFCHVEILSVAPHSFPYARLHAPPRPATARGLPPMRRTLPSKSQSTRK